MYCCYLLTGDKITANCWINKVFVSKAGTDGETEYVVAVLEPDGGGTWRFGLRQVSRGVVDLLGEVVDADVVPEVKKDGGDGDGYTK